MREHSGQPPKWVQRLRSEVPTKTDTAESAGSSAGPLKHIWVLSAATGQAPVRQPGQPLGH